MKISYENLHEEESSGPTLAELLLSLEADLTITDDGREILSEPGFPVVELAYHLAAWLDEASESEGFEFDSMSADPGWVRIVSNQDGWMVGSILEPDSWTRPVELDALKEDIRHFVKNIRSDLAAIGVNPHFIPEPE